MKLWHKRAITGLLVVTMPIWFIPFLLVVLVALLVCGMYDSIYRGLWGK